MVKCNDHTFGERGGLELAKGLQDGCPALEILDGMNNVSIRPSPSPSSSSSSSSPSPSSPSSSSPSSLSLSLFVVIPCIFQIYIVHIIEVKRGLFTMHVPYIYISLSLIFHTSLSGFHPCSSKRNGNRARRKDAPTMGVPSLQQLWRSGTPSVDGGAGRQNACARHCSPWVRKV